LSKEVLFSIITVCYNAEDVLNETIQSVVGQKFEQIEYIIIDGNSTDGTLNIIRNYEDKVDCVISEPDQGIYDAMNKGLRLAKGKFVNFLNAGDRFVSNSILNEITSQIDISFTEIISGDFILINNKNNTQRNIRTKSISYNNLKKDFYACHQSIFINKNIAKEYDLNYQIKADYKWVLEALAQVKEDQVCKLDFPIVYYAEEGFSNNYLFKNLKELIQLHYEFFGPWQVIKNSHIYIYRLLRSLKDILVNS